MLYSTEPPPKGYSGDTPIWLQAIDFDRNHKNALVNSSALLQSNQPEPGRYAHEG